MSSKRKLKRRNPAPVAGFKYERMCQAVSEQAIYRVLAVAIDICLLYTSPSPRDTR